MELGWFRCFYGRGVAVIYSNHQNFCSTMPILLMYPFFQKYFTKGLVVGSVKG